MSFKNENVVPPSLYSDVLDAASLLLFLLHHVFRIDSKINSNDLDWSSIIRIYLTLVDLLLNLLHFKSKLKKGISLGKNENIPDKSLINKTIILKDDNKFYIKETDEPWGTNDKNERILDIKINSIKNIDLESKITDWRSEVMEKNKFYSYLRRILI